MVTRELPSPRRTLDYGRGRVPTTTTGEGAPGPLIVVGTAGQPRPEAESNEPVPTEDWVNPYYRAAGGAVSTAAPIMRGSMFVQWPLDRFDVVPKRYVDLLKAGGLSSIWQPWAPGRWFGPPAKSYATLNSGATVVARMGLMFLTATYTFDQFGFNVTGAVASPTSLARCGVYRISDTTLLPTALLADFGTISTTTAGVKTASISPALSVTGTIGLVVQLETGSTTYPQLWCEQDGGAGGDFKWYGTDSPASLVAGGLAESGFGLARTTSLSAGSLPDATSWSYSHISANGGGLMLRRAS